MDLEPTDTSVALAATAALAADPAPGVEGVLELIGSVITCRSVSFNDMTMATGDFRHVVVPPDPEPLAHRLGPVYDRLAHQHPLITALRDRGSGLALRFCDVSGGETFADTELYREFYEPFGIRYQLVVALPSPPDVVVGYACNRSLEQGEFSDRDVAMVHALEAPLAMHHRHLVDRARLEALTAPGGPQDEWVVLTVRSDGVVAASSDPAHRVGFAPDGRVPDEVMAHLDPPSGGRSGTTRRSGTVTIEGTSWRYLSHPVPVGPTVVAVQRLDVARSPHAVLAELGMTARQSAVAIELARSGGTNAQLARALGIAEGTVKKHLESVFRLLGVDSRAAAAVAVGEAIG